MSRRALPLQYGMGTKEAVAKIESDAKCEVAAFGKPSFSSSKKAKKKVSTKTPLK